MSEFDSVGWTVLGELTSSSRSDKEAVPTCSRTNVDCGRFSVAEKANSASSSFGSVCPPVAEDADSVGGAEVKELDIASGSEVEEVASLSGWEVEAVDRVSGSELEEVDSTSGSELEKVVSV